MKCSYQEEKSSSFFLTTGLIILGYNVDSMLCMLCIMFLLRLLVIALYYVIYTLYNIKIQHIPGPRIFLI